MCPVVRVPGFAGLHRQYHSGWWLQLAGGCGRPKPADWPRQHQDRWLRGRCFFRVFVTLSVLENIGLWLDYDWIMYPSCNFLWNMQSPVLSPFFLGGGHEQRFFFQMMEFRFRLRNIEEELTSFMRRLPPSFHKSPHESSSSNSFYSSSEPELWPHHVK